MTKEHVDDQTWSMNGENQDYSLLNCPAEWVELLDPDYLCLPKNTESGTAAGLGLFGAAFVASGDVKVNWREVTKGRQELSVGDVISCRGKGRVEVQDIRPARKEGRFAVRLLRFV